MWRLLLQGRTPSPAGPEQESQGSRPALQLRQCYPLTGCFSSPFGRDPNGFADWTFSTVRCWGEEAQGMYRLVIRDIGESCPSEVLHGAVAAAPCCGLRSCQLSTSVAAG